MIPVEPRTWNLLLYAAAGLLISSGTLPMVMAMTPEQMTYSNNVFVGMSGLVTGLILGKKNSNSNKDE